MVAISVVIPAHNEAENLTPLFHDIWCALEPLEVAYEILIIDDGSTDDTANVLTVLAARYETLRVLRFDANYGQSAAFDAGFRAAIGDVVVTLDADGQNPPSEIPKLLAALGEQGEIGSFDMVCGWRLDRQDHWTKLLASKFANTLRRRVLRDGIHDTGCSLKAFRRHVVERLKLFHGMHRFLPALVQMEGYRITEVRVAHRPRQRGRSHYGLFNRLLGPLTDLLVVYWMRSRSRRWKTLLREAHVPMSLPSRQRITTVGNTSQSLKSKALSRPRTTNFDVAETAGSP